MESPNISNARREPWNKGKLVGQKAPLKLKEIGAIDAPFPDESCKEGARQFPVLVPTSPSDPASPANRRAWEGLRQFNKPFLTAFSDKDPITAAGAPVLRKLIPGCQGQPHTTIENAGHFLQEDQGERLAQVVVDFADGCGAKTS